MSKRMRRGTENCRLGSTVGIKKLAFLQEIVLGIGGVRVLRALGITPNVWHLNEGHAAFVTIERLREFVVAAIHLADAIAEVQRTTVFTTHTPVPAGHDAFPFHLVEKYLHPYWHQLGIDRERFLAFGAHRETWGEVFHMTVLALQLTGYCNGVSKTHGEVSRRMWQHLWPEHSLEHVPISSITNGVHTPTWLDPDLHRLYDRYLGPDWQKHHDNPAIWLKIHDIPDQELWWARLRLKYQLMHFIRERARQLWRAEHRDPVQVLASGALLDPEALTIGFARRFATYKRATLLLQDLARLQTILQDRWKPVQIVLPGKPTRPMNQANISSIKSTRWPKSTDSEGKSSLLRTTIFGSQNFSSVELMCGLTIPFRRWKLVGPAGKRRTQWRAESQCVDGWWWEGYNGGNGWTIGPTNPLVEIENRDIHDADHSIPCSKRRSCRCSINAMLTASLAAGCAWSKLRLLLSRRCSRRGAWSKSISNGSMFQPRAFRQRSLRHQAEPNLQLHLKLIDLPLLNQPSGLGHLKPVEILEGLIRAADRALDRVFNRLTRNTHEFDELIGFLLHNRPFIILLSC